MGASTIIRMKDGEEHGCVEWPSKVVEERAVAIADERLMELELYRIPTGQRFWLDPTEISSIKPACR